MTYIITAVVAVILAFPAGFAAAAYGFRNAAMVVRPSEDRMPVIVGVFSARQAAAVAASVSDAYLIPLRPDKR